MRNVLPTFYHKLSRAFFSLSLLLTLTGFLFIASNASAIGTERLGISPTHSTEADFRTKSWLIFTLPAGEVRQDSVTVTNNANEAITAKVYAVDSTTTNKGDFALKNETDPKTTIGAWVKIDTKEFTLAPKEEKVIPFTISIPQNANVGEYSGGIVVQETQAQRVKRQGMDINVISRVGVRIFETVPGLEKLNMVVSNFKYNTSDGYLTFSFTLENKSTVNLTPRGVLEVKDMFGRQVELISLDKKIDTMIPNVPTTISIPTKIQPPVLGWDSANLSVYYSPTQAAGASMIFMPNKVALVALMMLVVLAVAFMKFKKNIIKKTEKSGNVILAPQVKVVVGLILASAVAFSVLISSLLSYFFGGR